MQKIYNNILVAANIISEKHFNESISHFKALFLDKFDDELLEKIKAAQADLKYNDDQDCDDDEDDFDDWLDNGKKIYQA